MIDARTLLGRVLFITTALAIAGCASQETVQTEPVRMASPPPPSRSYLDPGPPPSRGGAGYVRDNLTSSPRQTDGFGNSVLPQVP